MHKTNSIFSNKIYKYLYAISKFYLMHRTTSVLHWCSETLANIIFIYSVIFTGYNIAALFTVAKPLKQPRCPSTDEWIKKMWYLYIVEFYSAIKKNFAIYL
jgi:hypothetical protein